MIDTLVYKFLNENSKYYSATFADYLDLLKDLFKYLKDLNEEQAYWYALGSNQKVYNKKCKFVKKAKKAYNKIKDLGEDSTDLYETLVYLFGQTFPVPETINKSVAYFEFAYTRATNTEEFIENKFKVDIRYSLKIDCIIKQDGYRPAFLRDLLKSQNRIKRRKTLEFLIVENEFEKVIQERDSIKKTKF
ncbi:nucleotide-binding domain-containing protein [Bacillus paranthracis]